MSLMHQWIERDDSFVTARTGDSTPAVLLQPPTPVSATPYDHPTSAYMTPSSSVSSAASSSRPITISRPTSRAGAAQTTLSRSSSARHRPYPVSPASYSERGSRPRSATSASDRSDWETDASGSLSFYSSSVESSFGWTPSSSYDLPTPGSFAASPYVADSECGSQGRSNKSHARKKEEGHIKRPPNAFILFRSHCCSPEAKLDPSLPEPPGTAHARHLASLDINNSQHISVIVSQVWKGLTKEEKAYWTQKAQDAKDEHARLHPNYRYQPQQRKKEDVRRRKRTDVKVRKEQTEACLEVARQVLEIERNRSREQSEQPLFRDEFAGDLQVDQVGDESGQWSTRAETAPVPKVAAAPKKKRVRKAATKGKAAARVVPTASPEGVFNLDLSPEYELPTPTFAAPAAFSRPPTAPYVPAGAMGDFSAVSGAGSFFGRRTSQTRTTQPYSAQDAVDQFGFMAQLQAGFSAAQPQATSTILDPQLAALDLSRPGTAASYSSPPTAVDPAMAFLPPTNEAVANTFVLPAPTALPQPPISRPPSPRSSAIQQLQSYTFGGPSTSPATSPPPCGLVVPQQQPIQISPTGSTFSFGVEGPGLSAGVAPLAERRTAMQPLPLDALKQRRDTLRPGNTPSGTGDLMLISPMTTTFNGRKQSTGTWSAGIRRLSLTPAGAAPHPTSPRPPFSRSSLSTGVLTANSAFETITVAPDLLESLPTEDPLVTAEFFAQFTEAALPSGLLPQDEYAEESRPSTACSDWSTDGEIERLDMDLPPGFFDRRRSTLVPSKFGSVFSTAPISTTTSPGLTSAPFSAPATHAGFHVGSADFFAPPKPPLSTAGPTTSSFATSSVPAFGSAGFGGSFQPFAHRPSVDAILAAASSADFYPPASSVAPIAQHPSPDVPVSVSGAEDDWTTGSQATASSMRDTALSILQERRQQQAHEASSPALGEQQMEQEQGQQQGECEYVYLTMEQIADQDLVGQIYQRGFGIAFDASPPALSSSSPIPSGETFPLGGSPLVAPSATF
ncbi:hypothetical protein JCM6882_008842 [Rhodosporidiobolus microsporus]